MEFVLIVERFELNAAHTKTSSFVFNIIYIAICARVRLSVRCCVLDFVAVVVEFYNFITLLCVMCGVANIPSACVSFDFDYIIQLGCAAVVC